MDLPAERELLFAFDPELLERELPDLDEPLPLPLLFAEELLLFPRFELDLVALPPLVDPLLFRLVERDEPDLEPPPPLRDPLLLPLSLEPSPSAHLPLITRCAASATASAMIEPRRVALDIIELAALDAVSAASMPASRIFLRAVGLALIAAAAAARPAASISLLIAALVILSMVFSFEDFELDEDLRVLLLLDDDLRAPPVPEDDFVDDFRLLDFAIANLPVRSVR